MFSLLGTFSGHLSRQTSRDILKETNENGKIQPSYTGIFSYLGHLMQHQTDAIIYQLNPESLN